MGIMEMLASYQQDQARAAQDAYNQNPIPMPSFDAADPGGMGNLGNVTYGPQETSIVLPQPTAEGLDKALTSASSGYSGIATTTAPTAASMDGYVRKWPQEIPRDPNSPFGGVAYARDKSKVAPVETTATPANPYMPQLPADYEDKRWAYNEAYKYYLGTGDHAKADEITDKFYANVGMERPVSGPGSKTAVAAAFGVVAPSDSASATPAAPTPIYKDVFYKDSDGVMRNKKVLDTEAMAKAAKGGATPAAPASEQTETEKQMKFVDAMQKSITKQFGFDPFMEDPEKRAYREVNDLYTKANMNMPGYHGQMLEDYNRLVKQYATAKQNALGMLKYGMEQYAKDRAVTVANTGQFGSFMYGPGGKMVGAISPKQPPTAYGAGGGVYDPARGVRVEGTQHPVSFGDGIGVVMENGKWKMMGNSTAKPGTINPTTLHGALIPLLNGAREFALKAGATPKALQDAERSIDATSSTNAELNANQKLTLYGSWMKTPEQKQAYQAALNKILSLTSPQQRGGATLGGGQASPQGQLLWSTNLNAQVLKAADGKYYDQSGKQLDPSKL